MKYITYKSQLITIYLSGWYEIRLNGNFIKFDNLNNAKQAIKNNKQ